MEGNGMEEEIVRDMTPRLIGETYMRKATETSPQRYRFGLYECAYCGIHWECNSYNIKSGSIKSCGCQRGKISHNRFYGRWKSIHSRCNNPKNKSYKDYGGRGIIVCEEWLSATTFVSWCEDTYIEGMTLDRIDNDKGYSPDNCRWTTRTIQSINQRVMKNNKSGYVGVSWRGDRNKWTVRIRTEIRYECLGHFDDLMEAVIFRDNYIIENKLPHKLNLKQEKINE